MWIRSHYTVFKKKPYSRVLGEKSANVTLFCLSLIAYVSALPKLYMELCLSLTFKLLQTEVEETNIDSTILSDNIFMLNIGLIFKKNLTESHTHVNRHSYSM